MNQPKGISATELAIDLANILTTFQLAAGVPIPPELTRVEIMRTILSWMGQPQPQPVKVVERDEKAEYEFRLCLGYLCTGYSVYDIVEMFLQNPDVGKMYAGIVEEIKEHLEEVGDLGVDDQSDELEKFYKIGCSRAILKEQVVDL